jgi:hypothetical protein
MNGSRLLRKPRAPVGEINGGAPRRFPSPWHADPMPGGYVVRDANGQTLAYSLAIAPAVRSPIKRE